MAIAPIQTTTTRNPPPPVRPDLALQKKADHAAQTLPRLHTGSKGTQVQRLQKLLAKAGANPGSADGHFGPKTAAAVKHFQKAHHLPQSGVADHKTWAALIKADLRHNFTFSTGQQDVAIKDAEARLARLGYNTGKVDGFMDSATAKAIKAFRADEGLGSAGSLTTGVRSALAKSVSAMAHAPIRARVKNTLAHRRLDAATATSANAGIKEGARGRAVKNVQAHLLSAGYSPSRTDGVFDERTGGAVKEFQRRSGLPATGVVDRRTWAKLKGSQILANSGTSPAQSLNEKSGAVKTSEALLKKLGFNPGKIDGLFDRNTQKAVKAFERKFKRTADGKVSTGDLNKMKAVIKQRSQPKGKRVTAYVNGRARTITVVPVASGKYMRADAAKAFKSMQAAARRAGISLGVTSGFRTMAQQKELYRRYLNGTGNLAARPGYSNHQNGIAVDISGVGGRGTRADKWLRAHARSFGFRNLPSEFWHYDFVR